MGEKPHALVLAQLLRCDYLPDVWEPDEKTQRLRHLTSRKGSLAHQQTAIKNRIHSVLHERLIASPFTDFYGTIGMNWLKSLSLDEGGRATIDSELRLLKGIQEEIALLDQSLYEKGYCDPRVKLLITLPGVDVNVAQTLLAVFGELSRFKEADKAASYLGLVPSTKQSAFRCYHGPITKQGNSHARWMLVQSAQHVANHPGPLGVFFRRLAKKKNRNVAVVATARKLVTRGPLVLGAIYDGSEFQCFQNVRMAISEIYQINQWPSVILPASC